ncbi:MAG TPA: bifunctional adenosylcobinamide kinase/adenosylcobinamide-phosphate guanylyltransferase [Paracoccaceae bacterium]|nr:bifunctional adenosylcobinamide kinase/adenosylcobinamide-phosphate guanylyltransferase [Paracoccaceae bacterium]
METERFRNANWRLALVLGGARSGKSRFAEGLVQATGLGLCYVATAEARDAEMEERITRHRARRGDAWRTVEAPLEPGGAVTRAGTREAVLVDCLTLWLANLMLAGRDPEAEAEALAGILRTARGPVALVSNEVGLGLVPETPLGRAFRDAQGILNQRMAAEADLVVFMAAGLPLVLKGRLG